MLLWKKILWLRGQIVKQRAWIARCGGDLAGYIANYGDPGVPPLTEDRVYATYSLTPEQQELFDDLDPVYGQPNLFYKKHFGEGGTAIYNADKGRLDIWIAELEKAEQHRGAKQRADEATAKEVASVK